jgi:uncharacterized membrane protein YciS (DUF1049 family)
MTRTIVGILIGVGFLVALVVATLDQIRVKCEVCMVHRGRQVCEAASAADRAQALMQATSTACAQLSDGVTDGIRCTNSAPLSSRCSD